MSDGSLLLLGLEGPELKPDEAALFRRLQPAGYILFSRNTISPEQTRKLTDDLRDLSVDLPIIGIDNVPGSKQLEPAVLPESCVLLFGQEGAGMSDEGIAVCEVLYEINQYGSTRSMNASAAGAIAMYHWALQHLPR